MIKYDKIINDFKIMHQTIKLDKDIIWYNDLYLSIIISKNISVKITEKNDANINYIFDPNCSNLNLCKLNYYDNEKISLINNYTETIMYRNKYLSLLKEDIRKLMIYDKKYSLVNTFIYFNKKFLLPDNIIIFCDDKKCEDSRILNLQYYYPNKNYFVIKKDNYKDATNIIKNNSCFINDMNILSYHNYHERLELLIYIYNIIIQSEINERTYIIKFFVGIKTLIIMQIIELFNLYFENVYIVAPKYELATILFYLILSKKNKNYDDKHYLDTEKFIKSKNILNEELKPIYTELLFNIFERYNQMCKLVITLKNIKENNKNDYKMIKKQLKTYKQYHNIKTELTFKNELPFKINHNVKS
ncbi:hypothetical protein Hokovirus_2_91 [Hokovirus HKV1]|uniref:Uncharacterized protein n=1 Tax=Hokovirus HKV1 TaxID=1977638 RepID=A0A1V0SFZ3_9VIRU|nr:hypothetical protein Hokovirus_2_91 [Hokovirus HKV1]